MPSEVVYELAAAMRSVRVGPRQIFLSPEESIEIAQIALEALRPPNETMQRALLSALKREGIYRITPIAAWRALNAVIDAALY